MGKGKAFRPSGLGNTGVPEAVKDSPGCADARPAGVAFCFILAGLTFGADFRPQVGLDDNGLPPRATPLH
jgi:hypothetical protein